MSCEKIVRWVDRFEVESWDYLKREIVYTFSADKLCDRACLEHKLRDPYEQTYHPFLVVSGPHGEELEILSSHQLEDPDELCVLLGRRLGFGDQYTVRLKYISPARWEREGFRIRSCKELLCNELRNALGEWRWSILRAAWRIESAIIGWAYKSSFFKCAELELVRSFRGGLTYYPYIKGPRGYLTVSVKDGQFFDLSYGGRFRVAEKTFIKINVFLIPKLKYFIITVLPIIILLSLLIFTIYNLIHAFLLLRPIIQFGQNLFAGLVIIGALYGLYNTLDIDRWAFEDIMDKFIYLAIIHLIFSALLEVLSPLFSSN